MTLTDEEKALLAAALTVMIEELRTQLEVTPTPELIKKYVLAQKLKGDLK